MSLINPKGDNIKAKTQKDIGEVTVGLFATLGIYRLVSVLSLYTSYQLPVWSSCSIPEFAGTLFSTILAIIYVFALRRKSLKVVRKVFRIWWILGLIELTLVSLPIIVAGKWAESCENFLIAVFILLCLWLPFCLITLFMWTGLKGLKRIVETGIPSEEQGSSKLRLTCPQCGRSLKGVNEAMIGDIGVCPKCRAEFTIKRTDETSRDEETE